MDSVEITGEASDATAVRETVGAGDDTVEMTGNLCRGHLCYPKVAMTATQTSLWDMSHLYGEDAAYSDKVSMMCLAERTMLPHLLI